MRLRLHWMRVHNKCKRLLILIPLSSNDRCCIQTDKLIRLSADLSHLSISTLKEYFSLDSYIHGYGQKNWRFYDLRMGILWYFRKKEVLADFLSMKKFCLLCPLKTNEKQPSGWLADFIIKNALKLVVSHARRLAQKE